MRWIILLISLSLFSCNSPSEQEKLHRQLSGNWLIVYPDHNLKNQRQRELYGKLQDSIVSLKGLKLISLSEDGAFRQMDSLNQEGKWTLSPGNTIMVDKGGKGFENYSAEVKGYKGETLLLSEIVHANGENLQLIWKLKKISGDASDDLFSKKTNQWRQRPQQPESEKQMKHRLADMLQYYSDYYKLVAKEARYFIPKRVFLPLNFYQHGIGLRSFDEESIFVTLFYNEEQAKQAHQYLGETIQKLKGTYPSDQGSFVVEYSMFLAEMADAMEG
jgi:hypothetical protein